MFGSDVREIPVSPARDVFRLPKFATMVVWWSRVRFNRNRPIRVLRDDVVIFEGELESLCVAQRRCAEVRNGMECGTGVKSYNDVSVGDRSKCLRKSRGS
jgi:translation initiation factor IF-2